MVNERVTDHRTAAGDDVSFYRQLAARGKKFMQEELFDGEYFIQQIQVEGLKATDPASIQGINMNYSPEALALLRQEGPKYQYGTGCLSDGVLGAWIAEMCGLGPILDQGQVRSHLTAVDVVNSSDLYPPMVLPMISPTPT